MWWPSAEIASQFQQSAVSEGSQPDGSKESLARSLALAGPRSQNEPITQLLREWVELVRDCLE